MRHQKDFYARLIGTGHNFNDRRTIMRGEPVELFITDPQFWLLVANVGTGITFVLVAVGIGVLGVGIIITTATKLFGD